MPSREHIIPRRVSTCGPAQNSLPASMADPAPGLHAWTGQVNKNFTAPLTPWDPDSRQQLETVALTASARQMYRPINPLTRVGVTSRVLNWDNPYSGADISSSPCSSAKSIYEVQSFELGALIPKENDSTDGTMYEKRTYYQPEYWSRASGPYGGPYLPVASCPEDIGVDSDYLDGPLGAAVVSNMIRGQDERPAPRAAAAAHGAAAHGAPAGKAAHKENLRSRGNCRRRAMTGECLSGIGCGLGSTWIDSRFEPGPQEMYPGGDAAYAHGGHAGGPTFGAFIPAVFQASGTWNDYVHGFGDGSYVAPTACYPDRR